MSDLPRNDDGTLQSYAWPGGYPLFYIWETPLPFRQYASWCPMCATEALQESEVHEKDIKAEVNWEQGINNPLYCTDCGERIESAYAEDEEEVEI